MCYPMGYEKTHFCASLDRRRAPALGGGLAIVQCLHLTSLSDSPGQRQRGDGPPDCPPPGLRPPDRPQCFGAFNHTGLASLSKGSSRPHTTRAAFPGEKAQQLRALLHQSPRTFNQPTSVWTLELAAEVSFQQGLTPERVSGETIRATLARLGVRWQRAKEWITSPDPAYARKKGLETD
jgi:hypothetical protein